MLRAVARVIDWIGRAVDVRELLMVLGVSSLVTGGSIWVAYEQFRNLPAPVQWLLGAGVFCVLSSLGGYVAGAARARTQASLPTFGEEHLGRSILVYRVGVQGQLSGAAPHVVFLFSVFNGSGVPITIEEQVDGRVALFGTPIREEVEFVRESHSVSTLAYPGHGTFSLRVFLPRELLEENLAWARSPKYREASRLLGGDDRPALSFGFAELNVYAKARVGGRDVKARLALDQHGTLPVAG